MQKLARFLPSLKNEGDEFSLNRIPGFSPYERKKLADLSSKMVGSQETASEPRLPSPFGRVWQFRRSLAGELGANRKTEAVSTFRGILSLIALRTHFHLPVELGVSPLLKGEETKLAKLFQSHVSCVPTSKDSKCTPFLWHDRMAYFYLRLNEEEVPFAGYSPLSLVYPAAKRLPEGLAKQIFWWDAAKGRLTDPLSLPANHSSSRKVQELRPWLKKWLSTISSTEVLGRIALETEDYKLIKALLGDWLKELENDSDAAVELIQIALPKNNRLLTAEKMAVGLPQLPAFFDYAIPVDRDHGGISDVPTKNSRRNGQETFIISLDHVAMPSTKIYGTVYGSQEIKNKLKHAAAEGANLGQVLGISAPMPYVVLDNLFEPCLPVIYQSTTRLPRLSVGWNALTLENKAYMYPFKSALLNYFSPEEIISNTRIGDAITGVSVTYEFEAARIHRPYLNNECPIIDTSMDLRLFPSFALDTLPEVEALLPQPTDRRYCGRLRLYQAAKLNQPEWLNETGQIITTSLRLEGVFDERGGVSSGQQMFWEINEAHKLENRPAVFAVRDSGMLFITLGRSLVTGISDCEVGLDFGTSNTCVFIKLESKLEPEPLRLPVFTTSLLDFWDVDLGRGKAAEGYSALFDFPYQNKNYPQSQLEAAESLGLSVNCLNPKVFFPTQIVHHNHRPAPSATSPFSLENGLAFFQNVTVTSLSAPRVSDLIEGFDQLKTSSENESLPKRFTLQRNLKWDDDKDAKKAPNLARRYIFHRHLRLQIILAAAQMGAKITKLWASYPKAFISGKITDYKRLLQDVWAVDSDIMSESAAAAADWKIKDAQQVYLIDIGGGTADFAIFHDKNLIGEASFRMAGSFLEEYFCSSQPFRAYIADAIGHHSEFKEPLNRQRLKDFDTSLRQPAAGNELLLKNAFQGILSIITPGLFIHDTVKGQSKSCAGFLLTNIVLYAGLAHTAGMLHRTLPHDKKQYQFDLQWVGNGSCFLSALSVGGTHHGFEKVLAEIFQAASGLKEEVACQSLPDAKTIVARGLLKEGVIRNDNAEHVASKTFSNSLFYRVKNDSMQAVAESPEIAGESEDRSLADFYSQESLSRYEWDGLREGTFKHFLLSLQSTLKGLRMGDVNLGGKVLGFQDASNWAVEYVETRKAFIATKFKRRMLGNYADWRQTAKDDPQSLRVEPLFITELCALLEDIREFCGNAA